MIHAAMDMPWRGLRVLRGLFAALCFGSKTVTEFYVGSVGTLRTAKLKEFEICFSC